MEIIAILLVPLSIAGTVFLVIHATNKSRKNSAQRDTASVLDANNITVVGTVVAFVSSRPATWTGCNIRVRFKSLDNQEGLAKTYQFLRQEEFAQFQVGAMLPVCYNPTRPQEGKVLLGADPTALQEALHLSQVRQGMASQEAMDVVRNGTQAQGVVMSAQPTGKILQGQVELRLQLKVTRPDGGMFEATFQKAMPQPYVSRLQVGTVLSVFFMPKDEQRICMALSIPMLSKSFMLVFG